MAYPHNSLFWLETRGRELETGRSRTVVPRLSAIEKAGNMLMVRQRSKTSKVKYQGTCACRKHKYMMVVTAVTGSCEAPVTGRYESSLKIKDWSTCMLAVRWQCKQCYRYIPSELECAGAPANASSRRNEEGSLGLGAFLKAIFEII